MVHIAQEEGKKKPQKIGPKQTKKRKKRKKQMQSEKRIKDGINTCKYYNSNIKERVVYMALFGRHRKKML